MALCTFPAPSQQDGTQVMLEYTIPPQSGEIQDTHTCSSCQIQFTSIEEYLKHKQSHSHVSFMIFMKFNFNFF